MKNLFKNYIEKKEYNFFFHNFIRNYLLFKEPLNRYQDILFKLIKIKSKSISIKNLKEIFIFGDDGNFNRQNLNNKWVT